MEHNLNVNNYVKKPVEIQAVQFTERNLETLFNFLGEHANYPDCKIGGIDPSTGELVIRTLEGDMRAIPSDYIIKGIKGEFYPCKEEIFLMSYELIFHGSNEREIPAGGFMKP